ncbi:MAG: TAXI family TRAP transporter solute-binding subunit [Pseudomonadota bacterium]
MFKIFGKFAVTAAACLAAASAVAQVNLTSQTAGPGTTVGLTANALVEYAAERGIANIQLKDGQTGTKYFQTLAEGKLDIGNGPFVLPFLMARAAGPYSSLDKETGAELASNIQMLYPYTLSVFTLYAYDAKGVSGWGDLKDLKILNGPPRGGATLNSRSLVQLFSGLKADEDYESVTVNWGQMSNAVIDGTVDAAVIPAMFPGPRVTRMGAAGAMTMHSMPKDQFGADAIQNFLNKPGSIPYVVPLAQIQDALGDSWTVVSEDDTFRGMGVPGADFVHKSMDEEIAYQLTKAHIDNLDAIKALAPFMATLNFGDVRRETHGLCGANQVKFHPGAVRAWEEAGYDVPDCAKP